MYSLEKLEEERMRVSQEIADSKRFIEKREEKLAELDQMIGEARAILKLHEQDPKPVYAETECPECGGDVQYNPEYTGEIGCASCGAHWSVTKMSDHDG